MLSRRIKAIGYWLIIAVTFISVSPLFAFTSNRETRGPLSFEFPQVEPITVEGHIYQSPFHIENTSNIPITVSAEFSSIETVFLYESTTNGLSEKAFPESVRSSFVVEANSVYEGVIHFAVKGAFRDAHYPIRAQLSFEYNNVTETVDLRPIFATDLKEFLPVAKKLFPEVLDSHSYVNLSKSNSTNYLPYWRKYDGKPNYLPVGWSGVDDDVKCSFDPRLMTRNGVSRSSWSIHPPYAGGPGIFGLRFLVSLPQSSNITLRFSRAMRDVFAPEPPTDGVIFRVLASSLGKNNVNISDEALNQALEIDPEAQTLLLNEQYAGTNWSEVDLDLSQFSDQLILLTFEADPGIKKDTTCDNSFWGDVAVIADPQEIKIATEEEREELRKTNEKKFLQFATSLKSNIPSSGIQIDATSQGFDLDDGQLAVVTLGNSGICDGWIAIGSKERYIQIAGVRAQYQGVNVGYDQPLGSCNVSTVFVDNTELEKSARIFAYQHHSEIIGELPNDANFSEDNLKSVEQLADADNALACFISKTLGGLAFRFVATHNTEIGSLQFGPISNKAQRVYFGHGHCIESPTQPFVQDGDGFGCASSHVGFDFDNGLSLLQATTRPIDKFVVNPDQNIYTLTTAPDSRLTLRSGEDGALACAIKYAPGFDKSPAPLVPQKAGRFVYDYWGGSYKYVLERMKAFVEYGLTDSLLIQHDWQHYGYDVRLPDIWPPNAAKGTLDDLKDTQAFCDRYGIPFGLHDNYIDFYPDADSFNYDDIIINPDGLPQKAWHNPGPDAQSYRFRPDTILPYAERNLNIIREELMQTAYFTDVFSSIHIMDFLDKQGNFHSRAETLDYWNKYFDLVREKFNNNAITISESGNDALIGHLEGADAILRRITPTQENYSTVIESKDSEYVPWFDAVNHARFILHGVGYSDRYQGGISRALRGIESDDYISSEVLTGHALMADLSMSIRGTVRKYWLLQNFARSLALDELKNVKFVDSIHRQIIEWKSGVTVFVNRGVDDWELTNISIPGVSENIVLPQFGFWIVENSGSAYGGVIRQNGQLVELRIDGSENYFVNGRQQVPNQVTPIRTTYENVRVLDSDTLTGKIVCNVIRPTDKPYTPFLHFERPQTWWNDKPELFVLPIGEPSKPSNQWEGIETDLFGNQLVVKVPQDLDAGYYNLLFGLYDRQTGNRLQLLGSGTRDSRYRLGSIVIEKDGNDRKLSFIPAPDLHDLDLRLAPNNTASHFGVCSTLGAFRLIRKSENTVELTPLPEEPVFTAFLQTDFFKQGAFVLIGKDREGKEVSRENLKAENASLKVTIDSAKAFSYEIVKQ